MLNMPTYDELVGGQTLEHYCAGVLLALPWVSSFLVLDVCLDLFPHFKAN